MDLNFEFRVYPEKQHSPNHILIAQFLAVGPCAKKIWPGFNVQISLINGRLIGQPFDQKLMWALSH